MYFLQTKSIAYPAVAISLELTYGLHGGYVIDEVPLRHIQRDFAIGRALLKHFEVVHHLADLPAGDCC